MGAGQGRLVRVVAAPAPWGALALLAVLLAGTTSVGQTLWAKVLTISGSVQIAAWTPSPEPSQDALAAEAFQGCSPELWKEETRFPEWPEPYLPEGSLADALGVDALEGNPTLLESLQEGGGGLEALLSSEGHTSELPSPS